MTTGDNNTKVAFKNCAPFKKCRTETNEAFVDDANFINIAIPMYNLIIILILQEVYENLREMNSL